MSVNALYHTTATATGGRDGHARTADGALDVTLSTPKELGGAGGPGNNPEQLFAAGYSACFLGAMKFVASQGGPKVPADTTVTAGATGARVTRGTRGAGTATGRTTQAGVTTVATVTGLAAGTVLAGTTGATEATGTAATALAAVAVGAPETRAAAQTAGLKLALGRARAIAGYLTGVGVPPAALRVTAEAQGHGGSARLTD